MTREKELSLKVVLQNRSAKLWGAVQKVAVMTLNVLIAKQYSALNGRVKAQKGGVMSIVLTCLKCNRKVKLTKYGTIPKHRIPVYWGTRSSVKRDYCPFSGRTVLQVNHKES